MRLDLAALGLYAGAVDAGAMAWSNPFDEEQVAVWLDFDLRDQSTAYLDVRHTVTSDFAVEGHSVRIRFTFTEMPFGGSRVWFVCPISRRRARCLYWPRGARTFTSRAVYKLAYRCERETDGDRLLRAARKAHFRLGGDGNLEVCPAKPAGMRWRTYWRLRAALEEASNQQAVHSWGKFCSRFPFAAGGK